MRIFTSEGAEVILADDGDTAVNWLRDNPATAHLIFMDIQMPRMNGYEATKYIRENLHIQTPIIALTAGAFAEHRKAAKEAGMNDFIPKPFDIPKTIACIKKWTGSIDRGADATQMTNDKQLSVIDHSIVPHVDSSPTPLLDTDYGLLVWGDEDTHKHWLTKFYHDYGAERAHTIANQDNERRQTELHQLKGVAGNLGLKALAQAAQDFMMSDSAATNQSNYLINSFLTTYKHTRQCIENHCAIDPALIDPLTDSKRAQSNAAMGDESIMNMDTLQTLLTAMESDNPDVIEPVLKKVQANLTRAFANEMGHLVENFDFVEARKVIQDQLNKRNRS